MKGVHENEVGSTFLRPVYRRGSIVRARDDWGVVTSNRGSRYHPLPIVTWWDGPDDWSRPEPFTSSAMSAPYVHTYEGVPDAVLAKATELMLTE